jgi:hypothetical protein
MNLVHVAIQKALCAAAAVLGIILILSWSPRATPYLQSLGAFISPTDAQWYRPVVLIVVGTLLLVLGILGLFPIHRWGSRGRTLTTQGPHGAILIRLNAVEAALNRVVSKTKTVERVRLEVFPSNDGNRVEISADVAMRREPEDSVRRLSEQISEIISTTAEKVFGAGVDIVVNLEIVSIKTIEPPPPAAAMRERPEPIEKAPEEPEAEEPSPAAAGGTSFTEPNEERPEQREREALFAEPELPIMIEEDHGAPAQAPAVEETSAEAASEELFSREEQPAEPNEHTNLTRNLEEEQTPPSAAKGQDIEQYKRDDRETPVLFEGPAEEEPEEGELDILRLDEEEGEEESEEQERKDE